MVYEISFYKTRDGDHDLFGLRYQLKDEGNYNFKQKCSEKLAFELLIANVKPKEKNINRMILKTINDSVETLNQSKLYKIISSFASIFSIKVIMEDYRVYATVFQLFCFVAFLEHNIVAIWCFVV